MDHTVFREALIFGSFYAVAFIAHTYHSVKSKEAQNPDSAHRMALIIAVVIKAASVAVHDYAIHFVVYSGHIIGAH